MAVKNKSYIIIPLTVVIYVINLIFNGLAGTGSAAKLFPRSVGEASDHFPLEMTPVGATFSIWALIFVYQLIWLIYAVSTLFRNGDQMNILSNKFYLSFITNSIFVTIWLFVWTRLEAVPSFVVITIAQVFLDIAIGIACTDLADYEATHEVSHANKLDVFCQRMLVQNGLLFYGGWTTVATLINTAVVFAYELGASTETASLIALSFLGVLLLIWFVVENFVLEKYTKYTCTEYVALIYALSGIIAGVWEKNEAVAGLTLALLITTVILFVVRCIIIVFQSRKRASYDNIGYSARSDSVTH